MLSCLGCKRRPQNPSGGSWSGHGFKEEGEGGGRQKCPRANGFLQQGFTNTLISQPMIYEEMGTGPSWAQSHCGTGFCILNKPVKEKQRLIFVLEDIPEQGLFAWLWKVWLRRNLGRGAAKSQCFGAGGRQLWPPSVQQGRTW